jgi:hypothetical protein
VVSATVVLRSGALWALWGLVSGLSAAVGVVSPSAVAGGVNAAVATSCVFWCRAYRLLLGGLLEVRCGTVVSACLVLLWGVTRCSRPGFPAVGWCVVLSGSCVASGCVVCAIFDSAVCVPCCCAFA